MTIIFALKPFCFLLSVMRTGGWISTLIKRFLPVTTSCCLLSVKGTFSKKTKTKQNFSLAKTLRLDWKVCPRFYRRWHPHPAASTLIQKWKSFQNVIKCPILIFSWFLMFQTFTLSPRWWQHTTEKMQPYMGNSQKVLQPKIQPPDVIFSKILI